MLNWLKRFCKFVSNKIVKSKKKEKSISAIRREALKEIGIDVDDGTWSKKTVNFLLGHDEEVIRRALLIKRALDSVN